MADPQDETKLSDEKLLATARKQFEAAYEEEKELRAGFVSDLKFASPDGEEQWDPRVKQQREAAGRPAMSFPRCHTFVQQVSNEARQNKPQIKFAQSDAGNKEAAEIMEGLARYIQYTSDAQIAYDTAIEYSAGGSFGYYRILTDYADDDTDDQEIKVVPVLDPLTVYGVLVPSIFGRKPKFWFVIEDMPRDVFEATYPDSEISSFDWAESDGWITKETVRVAEYWRVEEKRIKGKRRPEVTIHSCKTNGLEILPGDDGESSKTVWPGTRCNVIPVLGKQMIIDGKPRLSSIVRSQKGAQQMLNYAKSRIAETLAQAPVSPFIAVEGQIDGYEAEWKAANTNPQAVLVYKGVDIAGRPAPAPQRQVYEPPIASLSGFVAQEVDDMKATTGIYDASMGNQGNETSGQAIARRTNQSNLTTMHFMDNLERSFKQAGEVIGELIPKIYDASRTVKILGPDEEQKLVIINQEHVAENGQRKHFDLSSLKGSWVITSGKAFGTKRAETFDMMQQLVQSAPNMLPMFGDVLFQSSDMAGGDIVAERFKKMLPPQLQDDHGEKLPPQAQAMMAQAQQQVQAMQGELQKLQFERAAKVAEHEGKMQQIQLQTQSSMQLEKMKLENALAIAEVETKAQNMQERIAAVEDMMKQFHAQAHDAAMAAQQHAQAQQLAAQQAQHQSDLADQSAQNQSALSAQGAAQQAQQQESSDAQQGS